MSVVSLLKNRNILGSFLGMTAFTVGKGGAFPDLQTAVPVLGDRRTIRHQETATVTVTAGSATVTGTGTDWYAGGNLRLRDLISFSPYPNEYYKIKAIKSDTEIELYEPWSEITISGLSMDITTYYIDWRGLVLLPGDHHVVTTSLEPGIAISGFDKYTTRIAEMSNGTTGEGEAFVFDSWGENRLSNLTFAPTDAFGALHGLTSSLHADLWAGMVSVIENCDFEFLDYDGSHSGGGMSLPILPWGTSVYRGVTVQNDDNPGFRTSSGFRQGAPTAADTKVIVSGMRCDYALTHYSYISGNEPSLPAGIQLGVAATWDINDLCIDVPDFGIDPSVGTLTGLWVPSASVVNLNGLDLRAENTHASNSLYGMSVTAAATVNVKGGDIEADNPGAGASYGLHVDDASAVVNLRGSRVKGGTNSINCAAGTVNVDTASTLIGTTTGAGTINTATDT